MPYKSAEKRREHYHQNIEKQKEWAKKSYRKKVHEGKATVSVYCPVCEKVRILISFEWSLKGLPRREDGIPIRRCHTCPRKPYDCVYCGEDDVSKFYKTKKDRCKKCICKYYTDRCRNVKKTGVESKGGKCEICGYDKCIGALDFHHLDPTKKSPKWEQMKDSMKEFLEEIENCQLLCKNCHAEVEEGIRNGGT